MSITNLVFISRGTDSVIDALMDDLPPNACAYYKGYDVVVNPRFPAYTIDLKGAVDELPDALTNLYLAGMVVISTDTPMTKAVDGNYSILPEVTACVRTNTVDGVSHQYLHLMYRSNVVGLGPDLVNMLFANLVEGHFNDRSDGSTASIAEIK